MADEDLLNGGAEEAAPEDDLRSTILAAVEKQRDEAVPEGETPEEKTAREFKRDQVGRFATPDKAVEREAKTPADPAATPAAPKAAEAPKAEAPADPNAPVANRPPVGWSPKSKADFATLAPHIQADISKREDEIQRGFAKLADYKGLEPYVEQAKSLGKDLGAALKVYEHVDRTFAHQGPIAGLNAIAENIGIDPRALVTEWARQQGVTLSPADGRQPQPGAQTPQPQQHDPLMQRLQPIENAVRMILSEREQQTLRAAQDEVTSFWADPKNPYAENVADIMTDLINRARSQGQKLSLKDAYDKACWQHDEVRELLINERTRAAAPRPNPALQARAAAKATFGAPAGGASPVPVPKTAETVREAIEMAVAAQR
jgi:hypothetical protein